MIGHSKDGLLVSSLCIRTAGFQSSDKEEFVNRGFVVLRAAIERSEVSRLRRQAVALLAATTQAGRKDITSEEPTERSRIENIASSSSAARALLAQPNVIDAVAQLLGGPFIPTRDELVHGSRIGSPCVLWQRTSKSKLRSGTHTQSCCVTYCLMPGAQPQLFWVVPGSHQWGELQAESYIEYMGSEEPNTCGAVPIQLSAGDAVLFDARLIQGVALEPEQSSLLMKYEFETLGALGKRTKVLDYVPTRQRLLERAVAQRQELS